MDGVANEVPVPREDPPVEAANQSMVPLEAVAPIESVPVPQREDGEVAVMLGTVLYVAVTEVRVEVQAPLLTST